MIMKKLLFVSIIAFASLCSCTKGEVKSNDIVGEWKATRIEATSTAGDFMLITDFDEISRWLHGLEKIYVTERNIQPLGENSTYPVLLPYEILDDNKVILQSELSRTHDLKLESVSLNEMIIRSTTLGPVVGYTSKLIYFERIK